MNSTQVKDEKTLINTEYFIDEYTEGRRQYTQHWSQFTGPSKRYQMLSNAMWNQEAVNFVYIDGSIFMEVDLSLRQIFLAELYDRLIEKLRTENIQMPFRLFQLRVDKLTEHGFEKCSEKLKQTIVQDIQKKYPGPICLSGYSSGVTYSMNILRSLHREIKTFIAIAPVINFSTKESIWQEKLENKQQLFQLGKEDHFVYKVISFAREQIFDKQRQGIQDKVTPEDYRISPLFANESQLECFKNVNFHLIYAEKDGLSPQQTAFKNMLDSHKIPNTLKICKRRNHSLCYFRIPFSVSEQRALQILRKKQQLFERAQQILINLAKESNLVTKL